MNPAMKLSGQLAPLQVAEHIPVQTFLTQALALGGVNLMHEPADSIRSLVLAGPPSNWCHGPMRYSTEMQRVSFFLKAVDYRFQLF
jgi:hypothetical protein